MAFVKKKNSVEITIGLLLKNVKNKTRGVKIAQSFLSLALSEIQKLLVCIHLLALSLNKALSEVQCRCFINTSATIYF